MKTEEIDPSEVLYEIKFESVLSAILRRGNKSLGLSPEDLQLAKDEVKVAIEAVKKHMRERGIETR